MNLGSKQYPNKRLGISILFLTKNVLSNKIRSSLAHKLGLSPAYSQGFLLGMNLRSKSSPNKNYSSQCYSQPKRSSQKKSGLVWPLKKGQSPVYPQGIPLGMNSGSKSSPNQKLAISQSYSFPKRSSQAKSGLIWPTNKVCPQLVIWGSMWG